jgi:hypothetical protein
MRDSMEKMLSAKEDDVLAILFLIYFSYMMKRGPIGGEEITMICEK